MNEFEIKNEKLLKTPVVAEGAAMIAELIERLIALARADQVLVTRMNKELAAEREELRRTQEENRRKDAQIGSLRKDAERYRWLRESALNVEGFDYGSSREYLLSRISDCHGKYKTLDAAIDAAKEGA